MWATQQRKWSGQDVSGCLGGHPRSDEELTRGLAEMMPRGQTSGSTCGWTHGIKAPHNGQSNHYLHCSILCNLP